VSLFLPVADHQSVLLISWFIFNSFLVLVKPKILQMQVYLVTN